MANITELRRLGKLICDRRNLRTSNLTLSTEQFATLVSAKAFERRRDLNDSGFFYAVSFLRTTLKKGKFVPQKNKSTA